MTDTRYYIMYRGFIQTPAIKHHYFTSARQCFNALSRANYDFDLDTIHMVTYECSDGFTDEYDKTITFAQLTDLVLKEEKQQ